jgi:hypothetical protein
MPQAQDVHAQPRTYLQNQANATSVPPVPSPAFQNGGIVAGLGVNNNGLGQASPVKQLHPQIPHQQGQQQKQQASLLQALNQQQLDQFTQHHQQQNQEQSLLSSIKLLNDINPELLTTALTQALNTNRGNQQGNQIVQSNHSQPQSYQEQQRTQWGYQNRQPHPQNHYQSQKLYAQTPQQMHGVSTPSPITLNHQLQQKHPAVFGIGPTPQAQGTRLRQPRAEEMSSGSCIEVTDTHPVPKNNRSKGLLSQIEGKRDQTQSAKNDYNVKPKEMQAPRAATATSPTSPTKTAISNPTASLSAAQLPVAPAAPSIPINIPEEAIMQHWKLDQLGKYSYMMCTYNECFALEALTIAPTFRHSFQKRTYPNSN